MVLRPLLGKRINTNTIGEPWGEVLRLVASLKAGNVAPSAMQFDTSVDR
ncbi:Tn3 family transposase [Acetobacter sacchari]|uniref:Tn3 family transposase n=1 Tax=Acetobacter sacchari TaxID=2661687 RepID=A0ABS3LWN1_9PROT|nr:Tn3 family transposase [Acetobacter sacchari]